MYAIVDCDNCFVSCERVFQPDLNGRPVVVLSNNDGCVVARSNEAKALGIKMGVPIYQIMPLVKEKGVEIRSSNYILYADMSNRVMSILRDSAPSMEIYSIDEAFLDLSRMYSIDYKSYGENLVKKIGQWTGMPISIGIAPTKTLGKVALWFAKHFMGYNKVCVIDTDEKRIAALKLLDISEVWGVGFRSVNTYRGYGIKTAFDFTQKSESWVRSHFGLPALKTWKELQGIACINTLEQKRKQSICTSRSFDGMVEDLKQLEMFVSNFAAHCANKLRREHSVASIVTVFAQTNHFREDLQQYDGGFSATLSTPANSTFEITNVALRILRLIYKEGYKYKRAGVIVSGTMSEKAVQQDLFDQFTPEQRAKYNRLSRLIDVVNNTMGPDTIQLGVSQFPKNPVTGQSSNFKDLIKHDYRSRCYSTNINDIIEVH